MAVPGLAASRSKRAAQSKNCRSAATVGAMTSNPWPFPQSCCRVAALVRGGPLAHLAQVLKSTSADVRSGELAANSIKVGAPVEAPTSAACREPAASMITPMSSAYTSSVGGFVEGDRIGKPGAALVVDDETAERRQAGEKGGHPRLFPPVLDMCHEARVENQIDGAVAHHLIREVHAVCSLRIAGLAQGRHGPGDY